MRARKSKHLILLLSLFFISFQSVNVAAIENSISISGSYYKASIAAYSEFSRKLKTDFKGSREVELYMSDIRNYEIKISEEDDQITVLFVLNKSKKFAIFGSGGEYIVDKNDFHIVKQVFQD